MGIAPIGEKALQRLDMLEAVVEFKKRFYRSPWASYDAAMPGSLRVLPAPHNRRALVDDYAKMQAMLFSSISVFEDIERGLAELERRINTP